MKKYWIYRNFRKKQTLVKQFIFVKIWRIWKTMKILTKKEKNYGFTEILEKSGIFKNIIFMTIWNIYKFRK